MNVFQKGGVNLENNDISKDDGQRDRPITERPDLCAVRMWHGFNYQWTQEAMEKMADFIEYLEDALDERDKDLIRLYERIRALENVR